MIFTVANEARADRFVADALKIGRNEAVWLINAGFVKGALKPSQTLKIGALIDINPPPKSVADETPKVDFDVPILYEDDELLVIDKPAGLVVHTAPSYKNAVLVDWLKAKGYALSNLAGETRLGIVHRIDKETTGALAIAKTNETHRKLSRQLETRQMGRYYLAIVDKTIRGDRIVDRPIARNPRDRLKMAIVEGGRAAKSAFIELAELNNGETLIAAKLFSGRTHQIRVHLQSIGVHIVGDLLYGYKGVKSGILPLFLHAFRLYLQRPRSGENITIEAPPPKPFLERLNLDKSFLDETLNGDRVLKRFNDVSNAN
ncbi:MAG: RluA family pseudouridine synthase [Helicobacteraceae bacterium]|jgi:23S rRNA pseudouridine1911/1915/1917 synthase|nr:RluA family pseudouridine synthase [Helicobacteraceae bacterium]